MIDIELTDEETKAIRALKRLAKKWPITLWLFAGTGGLDVMKKNDGEAVYLKSGNVDGDYKVDNIYIEADGGDY